MKLVLKNNKEFEVQETSTIETVTILVDTYKEVETIANEFSEENLKHVLLNEIVFERIKPLNVLTEKVDGKIAVTLKNRKETELEKIKNDIVDLQEALIGGGIE